MNISGFRTLGICPFSLEVILKKKLMPSAAATSIVNQVQQATPSDKSTEQNPAITPATLQSFSTLPKACQNPLVSTGLIIPDLAEILRPDQKIKPPRVIIEERLLIENDWRDNVATKHKEKKQKELCLKLFHERKKIRKSAAKANKKVKETSTITRPFEKNKQTLWLLFMDGVQLSQGYSHFEEAVYFSPFSSLKFLVLILSTLEG